MRRQGSITRWIDDRGFGFVTDEETGEEAFLHVRALSRRSIRPQVGDRVSFDVRLDERGRPQAVRVAHARGPVFAKVIHDPKEPRTGRGLRGAVPGLMFWISLVLAVAIGFGWFITRPSSSRCSGVAESIAAPRSVEVGRTRQASRSEPLMASAPTAPRFACEGKTHCSQMTSCDEALFYLQNCPGSVTDGDGDGRPCEDQWCGH